MKKSVILILFLFLALSVPVRAMGAETQQIEQDTYSKYLDQYDVDSIYDCVPQDALDLLDELGMQDFDFKNILDLTPQKLWHVLQSVAEGRFKGPLTACAGMILLILFSAFLQSLKTTVKSDMLSNVFSVACSVIIAVILSVEISDAISLASSTIKMCADFIYGFVPVFGILVAVSGGITASFSTNALLLGLAQFLNFLSGNLFVPVISCYLALGLSNGIRPELHLTAITSAVKKYISAAVSLAATGFVSILSIKTAVASRADALGLRSARFAINSVVPVIGSAISEGLLSIQSYSSLIKSTVGIVGIVVIVLIFLPALLEILIWKFFLSVSSIASEMFEDRSVLAVLQAFQGALLLMLIVLILSLVTTVISFGILIAVKNQVS
ncbi:MAG TPA: hypothetical protein IAD23_06030 [Candidatus Scubalenecus merdavium]|uniref:Stage III sporulation protein AE n=1 Tax=Candidatus Scybalenecus merdavium TaxID=2840939 RepID=A0A9D1SPE4_9FIRM|nr:hypothetical protein [Candidatus Scubalenecus merdavium]